jgi:hypothetical protein
VIDGRLLPQLRANGCGTRPLRADGARVKDGPVDGIGGHVLRLLAGPPDQVSNTASATKAKVRCDPMIRRRKISTSESPSRKASSR